MPCDTKLKRGQTISDRKKEVRKARERIAKKLATGTAKAVVSKQGAIAFTGITDEERDGITDACIYRHIAVHGTALEKAAIARAEQLAGVSVNKQVIGQGVHSHDGGHTWHDHKG